MKNILICSYDEKLIPINDNINNATWQCNVSRDFGLEKGKNIDLSLGFKVFLPTGRCIKIYGTKYLFDNNLILNGGVQIHNQSFQQDVTINICNNFSDIIFVDKYANLVQIVFEPYLTFDGIFGTKQIPSIEYIVDEKLYKNFFEKIDDLVN